MSTATAPIATTTVLSVLLHAVAVTIFLLLIEQSGTSGQSVDIELVSSLWLSDQHETSNSSNDRVTENNSDSQVAKAQMQHKDDSRAEKIITVQQAEQKLPVSSNSTNRPANKINRVRGTEKDKLVENMAVEKRHVDTVNDAASIAESTNAVEQQHTIIELLHTSISNNREYPYLARRQHREGVATVAFVLHPDGSIKNTHLVTSSRTAMLDRAALAAVSRIEPFAPARDYLRQAREFRIDVVFKLL